MEEFDIIIVQFALAGYEVRYGSSFYPLRPIDVQSLARFNAQFKVKESLKNT